MSSEGNDKATVVGIRFAVASLVLADALAPINPGSCTAAGDSGGSETTEEAVILATILHLVTSMAFGLHSRAAAGVYGSQ